MARVVLEHLSKVFTGPEGEAVAALADINLEIEAGELMVLVGPSGGGKTTLLRLVAGLDTPSGGSITIGGRVVNEVAPKDRDVAMVFQSPALYPHLSAAENIGFGLRLRGLPREECGKRVSEVAALLGITDCLGRKPMALSGGQRQRVALGRALVRQPKLLLLDEPLSSLDAPLRAQMRTELARLNQTLGTTMLYVTHSQAEAMNLGRRIAVLHEGRIQQVADSQTLRRSPANAFVAGFLGTV